MMRALTALAILLSLPFPAIAQTKPVAVPPKAAAAAVAIPRMSPGIVRAALNAWNGASTQFTGLFVSEGETTKLHVSSNRQHIAFKSAQLVGSDGKFNPPADMRLDVVTIVCGDNDRAELFECVKVTVTAGGRAVKPLTYRAANDVYQNGFGAKWRAKDVVATYAIGDLVNGFKIDYSDETGVEWTFEVSADDAAKELLLTVKPLEQAK